MLFKLVHSGIIMGWFVRGGGEVSVRAEEVLVEDGEGEIVYLISY